MFSNLSNLWKSVLVGLGLAGSGAAVYVATTPEPIVVAEKKDTKEVGEINAPVITDKKPIDENARHLDVPVVSESDVAEKKDTKEVFDAEAPVITDKKPIDENARHLDVPVVQKDPDLIPDLNQKTPVIQETPEKTPMLVPEAKEIATPMLTPEIKEIATPNVAPTPGKIVQPNVVPTAGEIVQPELDEDKMDALIKSDLIKNDIEKIEADLSKLKKDLEK